MPVFWREPGRGVPEVVPAFGPQDFDLDEQVGFFGIEAVPACLQPFGPVRQARDGSWEEQVLVGVRGREVIRTSVLNFRWS